MIEIMNKLTIVFLLFNIPVLTLLYLVVAKHEKLNPVTEIKRVGVLSFKILLEYLASKIKALVAWSIVLFPVYSNGVFDTLRNSDSIFLRLVSKYPMFFLIMAIVLIICKDLIVLTINKLCEKLRGHLSNRVNKHKAVQ